MQNRETLIQEVYAAFNRRDIDAALAPMSKDVSWPKASEGGRVIGKEEIRAYWTRQWAEFDPRVEPVSISDSSPFTSEVKVHQLVRNLQGELLSDQMLLHTYTFRDGLIERMELGESKPAFGG